MVCVISMDHHLFQVRNAQNSPLDHISAKGAMRQAMLLLMHRRLCVLPR